jgi:hypothetical protein
MIGIATFGRVWFIKFLLVCKQFYFIGEAIQIGSESVNNAKTFFNQSENR